MARAKHTTAAMIDRNEPTTTGIEGETLVDTPPAEAGGEKGFKYEKNHYGHFSIMWEDGSRDVPAALRGTFTTLAKARKEVVNYFAERRAPREKNTSILA